MTAVPRSGMVLAAGLGTRLRPVTETIPKPLVEINGRTLLDHAIDRLALVGIERVVVNVHHKREMVVTQLSRRDTPRIEISEEPELLGTGGGIKQALPLLNDAFFVVNSDVFWLDGKDNALLRLASGFDADDVDAILLLQRRATAIGYEGSGDYFLDGSGIPHRRGEHEVAPYLFAGIRLLHRRLFDAIPDSIFSIVPLFDRAEHAGRLRAIVHDGEWYHISTPEGLTATRARLSSHRAVVPPGRAIAGA